jgi:predicted MFS family arabinose efflux permease
VGAGLALLSWRAPLAAQAALLPLALVAARVLDDVAPAGATSRRGYAREVTAAVRAPGMPAVLTAGFVRFWCKFAVVAYVPLMLVRGAGATVAEAAAVVAVTSLTAALASTRVLASLRLAPASRLLMGAVALLGGALLGFAAAPDWRLALAAAVVFGIGDGFLMVLQNAFVTEGAPADVRAGVVAVSGTTRNAGKLLAPLAVGGLLVIAPLPAAFVVVALTTWAVVPAMRSLARLDSRLGPRMIVSDIQRSPADARHVP